MATFKPIVFQTQNHQKSDGTTNIKIRIYHNGKSQYIPTPYYIKKEYLSNDGTISKSYSNAEILNFELCEMLQKYRAICIKLGHARCARMTSIELKEQLEASMVPEYESIDFVQFANDVISKTEKDNTAAWYETALSSLCWFYGRKIIDVKDITSKRLNEFMVTLAEKGMNEKPLEPGAISNYIRAIRSLFNKAKAKYNNEDYDIISIQHDPFKNIKIPIYRRKRKSIIIDDIIRIRDKELSGRMEIARDVFMMLFYLIGININDLYKLSAPINGRIEYERSKTNTEDNIFMFALSIKVQPELQLLFDKYSSTGFLSELKNRYSNHKNFTKSVNKGLEDITDDLKITKITTNWARHSWASIARNKAGISKSDIDFCLGHVNNDYKMADIYIDIDYSICDRCNRAVLDLLLKEK
ncbi:MAG: phage integrase SAM-like domain-containing protein [Paludibacteraceae bacterium]|nr:phage integrase SAM-like domain-containing protein [Paludibacteraceae bacterium]